MLRKVSSLLSDALNAISNVFEPGKACEAISGSKNCCEVCDYCGQLLLREVTEISASPPTSEVKYCCAICDTPNAYWHWYPTLKHVPVKTNLLTQVIVSTSSSGQPSNRAVWSPHSMYAFIFSIMLAPLCFARLCTEEFLQKAWLVLRLSCCDITLVLVTMCEVLVVAI